MHVKKLKDHLEKEGNALDKNKEKPPSFEFNFRLKKPIPAAMQKEIIADATAEGELPFGIRQVVDKLEKLPESVKASVNANYFINLAKAPMCEKVEITDTEIWFTACSYLSKGMFKLLRKGFRKKLVSAYKAELEEDSHV